MFVIANGNALVLCCFVRLINKAILSFLQNVLVVSDNIFTFAVKWIKILS